MRNWSEEESRQYVEIFREYRGDKRCRKCSWFGHMAHQCHDSEPNPKLSPAFIGLLNNLRDYNIPKSIYSPGQVTLLRK